MANPIIHFDGNESNYIDDDQLEQTIRLTPTEYGSLSYGDVFIALEDEGLKAEDLTGLYKVSPNDRSFSLIIKDKDTAKRLMEMKYIGRGSKRFTVMLCSEQIVSLRVHWLPMYYQDRLLKAIFCDFGEVLEVKHMKTSYTNVCTLNGMREVILKTDEKLKQRIPHMVKFGCGQSMLITMQGRPPLCLKCHEVGHTRRECETTRYARVASFVRPAAQSAREPRGEVPSGPVRSEGASPPPVEGTGAPVVGGDMSGVQTGSTEDVEMTAVSSKRRREKDDDDDSFIPPNKPARMTQLSPEPPASTSNMFAELGLPPTSEAIFGDTSDLDKDVDVE